MSKRNLIYTVAFDPPNSEGMRTLSKMLVSSLLRTHFDGEIVVFRNFSKPLFLVERKGVHEIFIPTQEIKGEKGAEFSWTWKYKAREFIDGSEYGKVMFIDADCLALRNIDHLFEGDWDISYHPERGIPISSEQFHCFLSADEMTMTSDGVNSGVLAIRGSVFNEVLAEWERIDQGATQRERNCSDQASWNRLLLDTRFKKKAFERDEVQLPVYLDLNYSDNREAAILHMVGLPIPEKIPYTFGRYMEQFFCDPSALFFHLIEM